MPLHPQREALALTLTVITTPLTVSTHLLSLVKVLDGAYSDVFPSHQGREQGARPGLG